MSWGRTKRRRHRPKLGDVFAIPLEDGYFGVTQIGAMGADVPTYVVFDAHLPTVEDVEKSIEATLEKPVATVFIAAENAASSGQWPFVGNRAPAFGFAVPTYEHKPGATSSSDHAVSALANTIAGSALRIMGKEAFRPHLVPGAEMPAAAGRPIPPLLLPPDYEERMRSPRAHLKAPAPGPARAIVTIPYEVDAPPSVLMLRRRQAFIEDVRAEKLGEVVDQSGAHGIVQVTVDVPDAAAADKPLRKLLRENGFEWISIQYTRGAQAPSVRADAPPSRPARASVRIPYEGDDLPPVPLVRQRQAFAAAVQEQRLGEVTDQGAGGGAMEVEIDVTDAARSHDALLQLLREHGLAGTIEYAERDDD